MATYEEAVDLWHKKNISTEAELAEALSAHSIAFAYNSGKIENPNVTYHKTLAKEAAGFIRAEKLAPI